MAIAALLLAAVPWLQWVAGIESYRGDALLTSAYFLGFALCIIVAQSLDASERARLADGLALAVLVAALCSVPLAVLQWTGWLRLDLAMKAAAGRPVAHMEQTNLLCTLLLQGVFGAWRLYERGRMGGRWAIAMAIAIVCCASLTQSRVAWMVAVVTSAAWAWRSGALAMRSRWPAVGVALLVVAVGAVAVPLIDRNLDFTGLTITDRMGGGRRPDVWLLFLDAVRVHPWAGWGALQNGAAQFELADTHPRLYYLFGSAHNVVLDLMVWFGAPIGLCAGGALLLTVFLGLRRSRDPSAFVTAMAAAALVLHGLVEFPLHYTFFLFPLGLMLGLGMREPRDSSTPRVTIPTGGSGLMAAISLPWAILMALLARDYIPLTDFRPVMEYDRSARHMVLGSPPPVADTLLLDQLRAFQVYAAVPAHDSLDPATIGGLGQPLRRYPYAQSQEHYAHIMALNGEPVLALDALLRSCKFMPPAQCDESHRAWNTWRSLGQPLPEWP